VATRHEQCAATYLAMVALAAILRWLKVSGYALAQIPQFSLGTAAGAVVTPGWHVKLRDLR
jgi:hypothetical protein